MNKYQEAINDIDGVKMLIKVVLVECEFIEDLYNEELDTLRKLLDKATPKKTIKDVHGLTCCPVCEDWQKCHKEEEHAKFCSNCGQALDWSEK